jgi:2-polyprenyl-6-methoxyphenol hydroxylase-like FAD-dependent oxidoreductase
LIAPGVVLIGDAAGANDPSQGHGLSLAFRDARELRDLLANGRDRQAAITEFGRRRTAYFAPLRAHAKWAGILTVDTGPEADRVRERAARARDADPTLGGYAGIHAFGPDGLAVDEQARRHFFGEDLDD